MIHLDRALVGAVLTVVVQADSLVRRALPLETDLAPLTLVGLDVGPPAPARAEVGNRLAVMIISLHPLRLAVQHIGPSVAESGTSEAIARELRTALAAAADDEPVPFAPVALAAMAAEPDAFRVAGRTLSEIVATMGMEFRLGWVGPPSADWHVVAGREIAALAHVGSAARPSAPTTAPTRLRRRAPPEPGTGDVPSREGVTPSVADDRLADARARKVLAEIPRSVETWREQPGALSALTLTLQRSYLIERLADEILTPLGVADAIAFLDRIAATGGPPAAEVAAAFSLVLPPVAETEARHIITAATVASPAVAGLIEAMPIAAWASGPGETTRVVIGVGKEAGRLSPLVAEFERLDDTTARLVDAVFLPDMSDARITVEVIPMFGAPLAAVPLSVGVRFLEQSLEPPTPPVLAPVIARIIRWVFRPLREDWPPREV
ncbi:MAG: hypothetical protein HYX33_01345 [Actinobacteria bacterium]|nr:hypothetical protein [Actinomycetota bacterium]